MDILYTENTQYFVFNKKNFNETARRDMISQIEKSQRHLVTITDPHIADDYSYFVRKAGSLLEYTDKLSDGTLVPGL